mmetsp:Transcript_6412/g.13133  ORF Transcript_6412/g.13133 Transcript_6412/m.13133 type:complete len:283 (-) Transcript_6412:1025-1873(-)
MVAPTQGSSKKAPSMARAPEHGQMATATSATSTLASRMAWGLFGMPPRDGPSPGSGCTGACTARVVLSGRGASPTSESGVTASGRGGGSSLGLTARGMRGLSTTTTSRAMVGRSSLTALGMRGTSPMASSTTTAHFIGQMGLSSRACGGEVRLLAPDATAFPAARPSLASSRMVVRLGNAPRRGPTVASTPACCSGTGSTAKAPGSGLTAVAMWANSRMIPCTAREHLSGMTTPGFAPTRESSSATSSMAEGACSGRTALASVVSSKMVTTMAKAPSLGLGG